MTKKFWRVLLPFFLLLAVHGGCLAAEITAEELNRLDSNLNIIELELNRLELNNQTLLTELAAARNDLNE